MKTRDYYVDRAVRRAQMAHRADPLYAAGFAAEGQIYATLATIAPDEENSELRALRREVAKFLCDIDTSADSQIPAAIGRFRSGLPSTAHGDAVLALAEELMAEEHAHRHEDGEPTASELHEMDRDAEFAMDAADEARFGDEAGEGQ